MTTPIASSLRSTINVTPYQPQTEQSQPQTDLPQAQTPQHAGARTSSRGSRDSALLKQLVRPPTNPNVSDAEAGMAPFPKTVGQWQAKILAQKQRPIDKTAAAEVLNEIRFNPHAPNALAEKIPSHKELKSRITSDHVDRWNQALGLSPADIKAMNHMAFWGGTTVPLNNSFFNAISFGLVPLLQYVTNNMKNPWAQAGVGLAVVAAQPILSSVVQTYAVASLEVWRQKNAPSVLLDKGAVNAKKTPRDLAKEIDAASQALRDSGAALNAGMGTVAQALGITVPDEGRDLQAYHESILNHEDLTAEQKNTLRDLCVANAKCLTRLGELAVDMQKADGGQDRAKQLNKWQIIPRTLRGASRMPAAVLTGYAAEYADNLKQPLSPIQISGVSIGVAMGCQLLQHLIAGVDEVAGQTHDHKMNMLHADVFTAGGKDAWNGGKSIIDADHLDENKLRGLVELPETQMAKRVAKLIEGRVKDAEGPAPETAAGVDTSTIDLEAGGVAARGTIPHRIEQLQGDLEHLRSGELENLSRTGEARKLVNGVMKRFAVGHAMKESKAKMTAMEFTAQLGQRIAQSFTFGVAGSAAAVTAGPVLTAVLGGNDKVTNGTKVGISLGNMAIGAFSAATQYMVVNVKNNRRDGGDMGFLNQVWQGVISPVITAKDYLASGRGLKTAEETLKDNQSALSDALDTLIDKAQTMPGAWPEDEPAQPVAQVDVDAITPAPPRP
jgi:hypothetical protein